MDWLTKQVSGTSGVKKMIKIWGRSKNDKCPHCRVQETIDHVMECKDKAVVQ